MADSTVLTTTPVEPAETGKPFAWRPVTAVAASVAVLLAATSGRYDYHRDELYFRELGGYPAWGYVDQPPLTPLLAHLSIAVFGDSVWALRLPAVLSVVATVFLVALTVRELGGGRGAQILGAFGVVAGFPLIAGHVLLTATPDLVVWMAVILCVTRALRRDEPRWWLAAGVAVGLGLYNKHLVVLLLLGLAVGLLLVGPRRVLRSGWLWAGVAIALLIGSPNLVYQATHGWPQFKMAAALQRNKGDDSRVFFLPLQVIMIGLPLLPVWVAGLVSLLRNPALRTVRALGVAYPVVCVLLLVTGGQPYYTMGLLLALYAAGSVATVRWLSERPARRALVTATVVLNVAMSALLALPLLPVSVLAKTPIPAIIQPTRDQIGWPAYVRQVADAYRGLPAGERTGTVIITGNYGEAGALDRYGPRYGLPHAYSGHNGLYYLGAPPASTTAAIVIGYRQRGYLDSRFASCETVGHLDNGVGIDNEEQGLPIWVCREPRKPWHQLWPEFAHLD